jgi:thimet oligopeptidase
MKTLFSAGLLAATALGGSAHAASSSAETLLGPNILANPGSAETITKRCEDTIALIEHRLAEFAVEKGPATIDRTLTRYDDIVDLLTAAGGEFTLYRQVMADDARRAAGGACEVRIASEASKLSLSRPIYERLKAIPAGSADATTQYYLTRTLGDFERAGVGLPDAQRAKAQALQDKIAELGTKFDKAIADGRKTVTADPAELEGLPADYIAQHKPGADGKITISTDTPDYVPVMTYAKSTALRERLSRAYNTRAYPDNDATLREMLNARQELATLLGRKDYATLAVENKMVDTPAKVEKLLTDMDAAARPAGERDYARKLAFYQTDHPDAKSFTFWDNSYLANAVQKRDFAYDTQETRQYFAYNNVRDGILKLTEDLFGVEIRPWKTETWDPQVEAYEMFDRGKLIGRFYFDSHPRPGKYNHANAVPLRNGRAGATIPVAALVMNMPAGDHTTGLMEHRDVETFLHEFGHLIHHIFGGQTPRWSGQSGVATEWDFVEAPSQMLEEWVYDYDTLKAFAVNAKGETIPRTLVEKMNKARYFDQGMGDQRQLGLSNISLKLHEAPAPTDIGGRVRELASVYDLNPFPEWSQMQDSFGHLSGYSAFYYTYRWSKVIADDMFTRFETHGLRDKATADRYRRMVLEPGGTKPAADLVQNFLGRPISLDAYKAEMAKDK